MFDAFPGDYLRLPDDAGQISPDDIDEVSVSVATQRRDLVRTVDISLEPDGDERHKLATAYSDGSRPSLVFDSVRHGEPCG